MEIPNELTVILIAEDSPTQTENLRYFLEKHGYKVIAAQNGRDALDMIERYKPHLLISDIIMPEMDGYELCRCLRTDLGLRDLPIIFLTVLSDPADIMKSLECGADSFIIKPFQEGPLLERIRLLLASQGLRQRQERQEPVEVDFHGKKYQVNADRLQIMNLLVSTYEAAVEQNKQLIQTQRDLRTQAQILTEINRIFHEAIICETEEELGRTCLAAAEELTDSRFGFIGEKNREGLLDDIAVSDPGWEACRLPGTDKPVIPKGFHIRGIFGRTIKEEKSVIVNDPASDPDRVGTPDGHPPIEAFLGVPLKQAGETIGMIGLGNKPGGYDHNDQTAAEALAPAIVESFLRKRAETRIKELNAALALHVRQLEAANQELEAFSYSVSHDLQAPLRGIMGYSRMLQEDYGEKLDDTGWQYLEKLQVAGKQMSSLIEALLGLSRVTRAEMRRQNVNLSDLARSIAENLQSSDLGRQVNFVIADGLVATCDLPLVKIVLENLLANAWKFTGKTPHGRIEFGIQGSDRGPVFFVRDNGVGFDMQHADKLFGAFQRLHGASEFPGTGIGLATVQRIINRHGGRIWAEAAEDHGATFYFTLNT
jgi:signal transduction histidine kinase/DNA-binding response OmpR family regulator